MAALAELAPAFDLIRQEAGPYTVDGLNTVWRQVQELLIGADIRSAKDRLEPKVKALAPTGATSNLALDGSSVLHFTGGTAFDLTGFIAPDPGKARLVILHNSGSGTITLKHEATSSAVNRLHLISGADTAIATDVSAIFIYLSSRWRQVK